MGYRLNFLLFGPSPWRRFSDVIIFFDILRKDSSINHRVILNLGQVCYFILIYTLMIIILRVLWLIRTMIINHWHLIIRRISRILLLKSLILDKIRLYVHVFIIVIIRIVPLRWCPWLRRWRGIELILLFNRWCAFMHYFLAVFHFFYLY